MSTARVVDVHPGSPADLAGISIDDEILSLNGEVLRDVIRYQILTDEPNIDIALNRGGIAIDLQIDKRPGESLGVEVHSAVFDQIRTCDNHCEFCFIYQLPKGLRESLYLKDDDYRLSFLYGNFTTLTRFTEADLERVVTEGLSPLNVSIHATDPKIRNEMLRNRRGGPSLRWLKALLNHGVSIHGQLVICPEINSEMILEDTLCTIFEQYRSLRSLCVVPLGVSKHSKEKRMRPHTKEEAGNVINTVERWQQTFLRHEGRMLVHVADEYYLIAGREFPPTEHYDSFDMYEDGVGIVRTFEREFNGEVHEATNTAAGFFAWVDGAPSEGYRSIRNPGQTTTYRSKGNTPVGILTGEYGARTLSPLVASLDNNDIRIIPVKNKFFGGNVAVAGLLVGEDIARTLQSEPDDHRYLLPDVCLSQGKFLDGMTPADLPIQVEIIRTDGIALREALGMPS
ncbi:MAG: DUF512 domain-containing protein [Acidimicrobiales bacterium]|jgi:putative radical SAM enzyme (TIGR03279 family)|nr:DUF512 domain-containing protein [Acidimicrobiales bacterium]HJM96645.1 DUF512 domain-containing protein [Acidimicrobiales bacterium]